MATATTPKLTNKVFTLLETLDTEQVGQVIDFMEFLKAKKTQRSEDSFVAHIIHEADPSCHDEIERFTQTTTDSLR